MIRLIEPQQHPESLRNPVGAANNAAKYRILLDMLPPISSAVSVIEVRTLTTLACGPSSRKKVGYYDGKVTRRIRKYLKLNGLQLFHSRSAAEMQSAIDAGAWLNVDESPNVVANLPSHHYVVLARPDTADGRALLDDQLPLVYRRAEFPPAPTDLTGRVQVGNALDVLAVIGWLNGWPIL